MDARIGGAQLSQHLERPVAAAVVDEHELPVVVGHRRDDGGDRVVERAQVVVLVEDRHDDRDERPGHLQRVTISATASMTRR